MKQNTNKIAISLKLTPQILERLDRLVDKLAITNRTALITKAILDYLTREETDDTVDG